MNIEEIRIDDETQLEEVERYNSRSDIPCVNINRDTMYFNKSAADLLSRYVKWYTTADYVIAIPNSKVDKNTYLINMKARMSNIPSTLRSKKIKNGTYKLYKYKDGFAFKRYEPIEGSKA